MKNVLITGVGKGLGKELFKSFTSKGHFVFGVVRKASDVKTLEAMAPENSRVIVADLASDTSIELIRKAIQDTPIDLLINNAGIAGSSYQLHHVESGEINNLFNVHCLGVLRTVKALQNNLLKADKPTVLNLNSRLGSISRQSAGVYDHLAISYSYRVAKAAQNMLTNCLRSEFRDQIQFISLHPGKMKTEIASSDADADPAEVAHCILSHFETGRLVEENGITELEKEIIPW